MGEGHPHHQLVEDAHPDHHELARPLGHVKEFSHDVVEAPRVVIIMLVLVLVLVVVDMVVGG